MMKGLVYILLALFHFVLALSLVSTLPASSNNQDSTNNQLKRSYIDSFEAHDNDDLSDDSIEYAELSPPDLQAYLYGRSLKGFNPWKGRRELEHLYKRILSSSNAAAYHNKHEQQQMTRQRRKPWGGSA